MAKVGLPTPHVSATATSPRDETAPEGELPGEDSFGKVQAPESTPLFTELLVEIDAGRLSVAAPRHRDKLVRALLCELYRLLDPPLLRASDDADVQELGYWRQARDLLQQAKRVGLIGPFAEPDLMERIRHIETALQEGLQSDRKGFRGLLVRFAEPRGGSGRDYAEDDRGPTYFL